jgi:PIN domain nuclease of toxin-antitoxin system
VKIILDTHIFLWVISEPHKLNGRYLAELETMANTVFVSSISIAEIMIKSSMGRLKIDFDPVAIAVESGFEMLDFNSSDASLLKNLPFHHKDPFDRMLITQSLSNNYALMSDDSKFARYECKLI